MSHIHHPGALQHCTGKSVQAIYRLRGVPNRTHQQTTKLIALEKRVTRIAIDVNPGAYRHWNLATAPTGLAILLGNDDVLAVLIASPEDGHVGGLGYRLADCGCLIPDDGSQNWLSRWAQDSAHRWIDQRGL